MPQGHIRHEQDREFRITLAQLNPTVGDVAGNAAKARAAREKALADGADLWCCRNSSSPVIRRKTSC